MSVSHAYTLYEQLMRKHSQEREWLQAKAIFECLTIRDGGDVRETGTADHSVLVAYFAFMIARRSIRSRDTAERYFLAGLLHDVGKIHMSDRILKSTNTLTPEDKSELPLHVTMGVQLLKNLGFGDDVVAFCQLHHEKLNGSGYPAGKKAKEIPLIGRIAAVADIFGAMRAPRQYRPHSVSIPSIIGYLQSESECYDAEIVGILDAMLHETEEIVLNAAYT